MNLGDLLGDLLDEQASLDEIVTGLDDRQWSLPTPSPRWSVADQIGHLCYFDGAAALAIRDPQAFAAEARRLMEASRAGGAAGDDFTLGDFRSLERPARLDRWRSNRQRLADAVGTLSERERVSWYGPSMGAKSFVTARLMEVWAHGQDVCDAVGTRREHTDRLRHIAQLGCITRTWSYINRGLPPPGGDVRLELTAPSGAVWTWGDADQAADNTVRGPALDFCLVVTQRRHEHDTALEVAGEHAADWMSKAQAFAGPPTTGPRPNNPAPPASPPTTGPRPNNPAPPASPPIPGPRPNNPPPAPQPPARAPTAQPRLPTGDTECSEPRKAR